MGFSRIAALLILALALLPLWASAQADSAATQSLAEIARQQRALSNKSSRKIFTNDDLVKVDFNNGAAREDRADDAGTATGASMAGKDKTAEEGKGSSRIDPAKRDEQFRRRYLEMNKNIEMLKRELNVLQREYQIQTAEFYADAGTRLRDSQAWSEKHQKYEDDIAAKQKQLEAAQQEIENLKEEARQAGIPQRALEPGESGGDENANKN